MIWGRTHDRASIVLERWFFLKIFLISIWNIWGVISREDSPYGNTGKLGFNSPDLTTKTLSKDARSVDMWSTSTAFDPKREILDNRPSSCKLTSNCLLSFFCSNLSWLCLEWWLNSIPSLEGLIPKQSILSSRIPLQTQLVSLIIHSLVAAKERVRQHSGWATIWIWILCFCKCSAQRCLSWCWWPSETTAMPWFSCSSSDQNSICYSKDYLSLMINFSCQPHVFGDVFAACFFMLSSTSTLLGCFGSLPSALPNFRDASDISWSHSRGSPTCHCDRALKVFSFCCAVQDVFAIFLETRVNASQQATKQTKKLLACCCKNRVFRYKNRNHQRSRTFSFKQMFLANKNQYTDLISAYSKSSGCMQAETLDQPWTHVEKSQLGSCIKFNVPMVNLTEIIICSFCQNHLGKT